MPVSDVNYNSTLAITDNVNNLAADPIKNNGVFQGAVVTLLGTILTKVNALNAKLDLDGGVTDTNYAATWNLAALDANQISQGGLNQPALYTRLALIVTNWTGILAKLDADGGVADTDYGTLGSVALGATVKGTGISQGDLVSFLDSFITKFNATLTKLDADN
jgi:hypothetical protein